MLGRGAVPGGAVPIDASASSQFVSGLLLAGARYDKGIEVTHTGDDAGAVAAAHRHDAGRAARGRGRRGAAAPGTWQVAPGPVSGGDRVVEPDLSNAAPFLAAALVTGGTVTVPGWPAATTQAGAALRPILRRDGRRRHARRRRPDGHRHRHDRRPGRRPARRRRAGPVHRRAGRAGRRPVRRCAGIGHLRGHETDRLAALCTELDAPRRRGRPSTPTASPSPRAPLHGGAWHAYADHRMATAGAVLGLAVDGVEIDDIDCTSKTLPDFPGMWSALLDG